MQACRDRERREAAPPLDFAKDLFPRMLAEGARLQGYRSFEYIKDVGTPARVDKAERHLLSGAVARARRDQPQAAVFLDRDGTLNELRDYVRTPEDLALIPGAADAVRTSELWSWSYVDGHYRIEPFGAEGAHEDESNAAQLWSTVFLALPPPEVATGTAGERSCR